MPVPEPDVLKRSLVVRRIGRLDGRLSRKLTLHDLVQSVGLPRQLDIVGNVGLLANKLVRFDNKAADVPAVYLDYEITCRGRNDRGNKPAHSPHAYAVDSCDYSAESKPDTDSEHAWNPDMGIGISHTAEDR